MKLKMFDQKPSIFVLLQMHSHNTPEAVKRLANFFWVKTDENELAPILNRIVEDRQ
jgi:hypothetical protein